MSPRIVVLPGWYGVKGLPLIHFFQGRTDLKLKTLCKVKSDARALREPLPNDGHCRLCARRRGLTAYDAVPVRRAA